MAFLVIRTSYSILLRQSSPSSTSAITVLHQTFHTKTKKTNHRGPKGQNRNPALLNDESDIYEYLDIDPPEEFDNLKKDRRQEINERLNMTLSIPKLTDMTAPHRWYPNARKMRRKWILHIGPTNSGKTHSALLAMVNATSGIYCAPLRLLASEVWEKLNTVYNVPCDLLTGQQQIETPGANHIACTIEMASIHKAVDVALIDEYQMISDSNRGWAWTRALLGIPAKEVHLTGDTSRIELIRHLSALVGDELEVKEYHRLSPLKTETRTVRSLKNIQEGDAIIAFSRKEVYELKKQIEQTKKMKCCVVYGSLPPESRSQQAKLFNEENNEFKILVGTDCIGMGLNLNIRRIVFSSCEKFDGMERRNLTPAEIRQIAGRAGRYRSIYPEGLVSSFESEDLLLIRSALHHKDGYLEPLHKAVVFPTFEQFSMFSSILGEDVPFSEIINVFVNKAKLEDRFEMACHMNMQEQASCIDFLELDMKDRYTFCMAPVDTKENRIVKHFISFAEQFSTGSVEFHIFNPYSFGWNSTALVRLHNLEVDYKITELYIWLANRYPDHFIHLLKAEKHLSYITQEISTILLSLTPSLPFNTKLLHKGKRNS